MIAKHKGEIPVVVLLLPFLAGIGTGLWHQATLPVTLPLLMCLGILFVVLNIWYAPLKVYKIRWLGGALMLLILFMLGLFVTARHNDLNSAEHFSKHPAGRLAVTITSEPKVKDSLVSFTARVTYGINNGQTFKAGGNMLITIKDELARNLFYGEQLLVPARLAPVEPPYNPGEFNYKRYLAYKNVHYQAFLFPGQYKIVAAGKGNPMIAYALRVRQNLVEKLKRNMHDTVAIAVASTLILGYKADLSNDVLQAYSKTGTVHILSVSGGHVAIIYLLLAWALAFLDSYKRGKVFKAIIIIALIWLYALLTGFSPAVCRAAVMISLLISGKTYSRYINSLNLLAVSAFALLLYDPFLLADVGFQLSYLAVGGLIVFQPIVYRWIEAKNKWLDKLWLACSASIAAQVITFPLSALYFHQFPVYFLLSNLLIIIPVSIIMYSGLALLVLPQIPYASAALGYVLEKSILIMNKALSWIEHSPYASINKIWLSVTEYLLLYAIILLAFYFLYNRKKWLVTATLCCVLALSISLSVKKISADSTRSVTFLNLRKHSGIVFKHGGQGVVITDLKQTDKSFQYSIQPCLDSSRITSYRVYNFQDSINTSFLCKQAKLVWFENKKLLLLNDGGYFQSIPQQMKVDYVYLGHNTNFALPQSSDNLLLMDGSNSDAFLRGFKQKADSLGLPYYILKRNKSFMAASNHYN